MPVQSSFNHENLHGLGVNEQALEYTTGNRLIKEGLTEHMDSFFSFGLSSFEETNSEASCWWLYTIPICAQKIIAIQWTKKQPPTSNAALGYKNSQNRQQQIPISSHKSCFRV